MFMRNIMKILFSLIISVVIGFTGLIAIFFSVLMGGIKFYTPLIAVVTIGIIVFIILQIFNVLKSKVYWISLGSFFVILTIVVTIYEINNNYHNSFAVVGDSEVNLYEYMPFHKDNKVVKLEEEATFIISEDLPRIDGATAFYPLYSAFVEATYPEKEYDPYYSEVMCTKTPSAYERLLYGEVDLIFALYPSQDQLSMAENLGVELELIPIGQEAFVFFVNTKNPVEQLTTDEIKSIYSGEITNWQVVGGENKKIRPFQRPNNSGSQTALQRLMHDIPIMEAPKEDIVAGMGGIIEQTANYRNYPNAIGYSFRYYSTEMVKNGEIKHLQIDGIPPTIETIRSGEYPLTSTFYVVTAGSDNPHIDEFIDWILSPQGQYLVEQTGYVPIH